MWCWTWARSSRPPRYGSTAGTAGIRVAPPWKLDITEYVKAGENRIEVLVYNTLANHYLTIPTRYRGNPKSGLLGPVRLEFVSSATFGE